GGHLTGAVNRRHVEVAHARSGVPVQGSAEGGDRPARQRCRLEVSSPGRRGRVQSRAQPHRQTRRRHCRSVLQSIPPRCRRARGAVCNDQSSTKCWGLVMAQRRDKEGREINPPYVGESMSEYTKARAGKMSSAEQAKIEARIGEASKKTRMVRETARI